MNFNKVVLFAGITEVNGMYSIIISEYRTPAVYLGFQPFKQHVLCIYHISAFSVYREHNSIVPVVVCF